MDEDRFNIETRKFLKKVGVTSQREIDKAVRQALEEGRITGDEDLAAKMTLSLPGIGLELDIQGEIGLEHAAAADPDS